MKRSAHGYVYYSSQFGWCIHMNDFTLGDIIRFKSEEEACNSFSHICYATNQSQVFNTYADICESRHLKSLGLLQEGFGV